MNISIDERFVDFYRGIIFGQNYRKFKNSGLESDLLECCFSNAWETFCRRCTKAELSYKSIIKKILEVRYISIASNGDLRNLINDISKYLTIGKSQKLVNIFFKYLYTFKLFPSCVSKCSSAKNIKEPVDYWVKFGYKFGDEVFDCPIDNFILEALKDEMKITGKIISFNGKNISILGSKNAHKIKYHNGTGWESDSWSKLSNMKVYEAIQDYIDGIVKSGKSYKGKRLDYDFDNW